MPSKSKSPTEKSRARNSRGKLIRPSPSHWRRKPLDLQAIRVFHEVGRHFSQGAKSFGDVMLRIQEESTAGTRHDGLPAAAEEIQQACLRAQDLLGEKTPLFTSSKNAGEIAGLSPSGLKAWRSINSDAILRSNSRKPMSGPWVELKPQEALAKPLQPGQVWTYTLFSDGRAVESVSVNSSESEYRDIVRQITTSLPPTYVKRHAAILKATHTFHAEVAASLQGPLMEHLRSLPQDSYEEKQSVASWVNGQLRELGLAIRCPRTGKPATLVADTRGGEEGSRFRLDVRGDNGRHLRTLTSTTLPELLLMEDEPRREGLAKTRSGRP